MVTSIVLTGRYNISISETGKIKTPDNITIDVKDVPFVRYRFSSYNQDDINFIMENKKKFPCVHVAEITLGDDTKQLLDTLSSTDDMIGKLVYIPITDKEVEQGMSEETLNLIANIAECDFDRLIIKDNSTSLHSVALTKLKNQVKDVTGIKPAEIGVCGGACCFMDGNACLTAVRAREMLAKYSEKDDIVVPSANHEGKLETIDIDNACTNHCGCIRYHIYNSDMAAPTSKSQKSKGKSGESKKSGDKKESTKKTAGYTYIDW